MPESGSPNPPASPSLHELYRALDACMVSDARRMHARLRGLERTVRHHQHPSEVDALNRIADDVARSVARVEARKVAIPAISYPDLPVAARRDDIMRAIEANQVVIVAGATGSGKTTQLPKMLLELGRGVRGYIGHTQPRRIAARSVATRIAQELGTRLGDTVGFKVRFTDQTSPRSLIKVMTDGILLAETQHDRYLTQYDTIIIDEAHERSLNIDFLLGYLKQLLPRRPDLKLIITSATIDPQSFADHFAPAIQSPRGDAGATGVTHHTAPTGSNGLSVHAAPGPGVTAGALYERSTVPPTPIIEVSGRTYPVEVRYHPLESADPDEEDLTQEQALLRAVDELSDRANLPADAPDTLGDILVFLPGEREIRETAEALRKHPLKPAHKVDVIPLYARLSADEQQGVFDPHPGRRRIILATNVAETSLTVPGIKYVIDAGVARISRYSPRSKVQRLPIEKVSRASANQRCGRCGRTSPGVCIRLYSEDDFNARPEFTDPEILRTNLASVILQMKALDLGDIDEFPFLQPPNVQSIRDGYDTLLEINALESGGLRMDLTPIGRQLARLPIDPRIGRMLLAADRERCLNEVLVIAAALSTQDPRERPIDKQAEADAAHNLFREEGSDFLGQLKLWNMLHKQQKHLSGGQFRKWCRAHFVSYLRFREWHDTHTQLRELMLDMGYKLNDRSSRAEHIHRALLTGLLSSIGRKSDGNQEGNPEGDYTGARNIKFSIFPGSVLFKKSPKWVMAAEIVKTTRTYARTVASISPQWIEPIAAHLVKRTYHDPHWNAEHAEASVYETVTLYGLEIVKRRRVPLAPVDPNAARALFIQHALVAGEYLTPAHFFQHNHELTQQVRDLQARTRTTDLLADQTTRFRFYDIRIPAEVATGKQFEHWRRKAESREPKLLEMTRADVLAPGAELPKPEQFPDSIAMSPNGARFMLEYKHDTGAPDDGVTIIVPVDQVNELSQRRLDWLVPGLVVPKIEALMRDLPKSLRASFVPIPQTAEAVAASMAKAWSAATTGAPDFIEVLTSALREMTSIFVSREHWKPEQLPKHLVMNIRVVDPRRPGTTLMMSRDLAQIRREFAGQAEQSLVRLPTGPFNRAGVFHWDFGPLPETTAIEFDGRTFTVHPALTDEHDTEGVAVRPYVSLDKATPAHAAGLRALFHLHTRRECRSLIQTMPGIEKLVLLHKALASAPYSGEMDSEKRLVDELAELAAHRAWDSTPTPHSSIRTKEQFDAALNAAWLRIGPAGREVFALAERILTEHMTVAHGFTLAMERAEADDSTAPPPRPDWKAALLDLRVQLAYLFPASFWITTPWDWLSQYPRYLAAVRRRLERLAGLDGVPRDTKLLNEIAPWILKLRIRVEQGAPSQRADPDLILFRWMLEEYRVSLWGADQRTVVPVSPRRLEEQWAKVAAKDA